MKNTSLKVEQLVNKNQFIIKTPKAIYFQSYESVVAMWDYQKRVLFVNKDWDCSNTTRKHLYIFIDSYCDYALCNSIIYAKNKRQEVLKLIKQKLIKISKSLD